MSFRDLVAAVPSLEGLCISRISMNMNKFKDLRNVPDELVMKILYNSDAENLEKIEKYNISLRNPAFLSKNGLVERLWKRKFMLAYKSRENDYPSTVSYKERFMREKEIDEKRIASTKLFLKRQKRKEMLERERNKAKTIGGSRKVKTRRLLGSGSKIEALKNKRKRKAQKKRNSQRTGARVNRHSSSSSATTSTRKFVPLSRVQRKSPVRTSTSHLRKPAMRKSFPRKPIPVDRERVGDRERTAEVERKRRLRKRNIFGEIEKKRAIDLRRPFNNNNNNKNEGKNSRRPARRNSSLQNQNDLIVAPSPIPIDQLLYSGSSGGNEGNRLRRKMGRIQRKRKLHGVSVNEFVARKHKRRKVMTIPKKK